MNYLFISICIILQLLAPWARSDERFRPKNASQLPVNSTSDVLYHVPNAQVVYVNYGLIRRDFKQTAKMSDGEIDHWIVENFAYVSKAQLELRGMWTSHYDVDVNKTKFAHRPPNYIRSGMIEAEGGGLVDVKGIGYPPGAKLTYALEQTKRLRENLKKARENYTTALAAGAGAKEAQAAAKETLDHAEALLTHIDGSMRLGEANTETYKQESLQQVANHLNQESNEKNLGRARIETVETYFEMHLPGKVKNAAGDGEEETSLYGRQATAGHGRGSDLSPEIAYNPAPHVGLDPSDYFRGSNLLQISNSGAIFDYGSIVVTDPEARARHGYRQYTQEAVNRGAYFDLYDSDINRHAYDLARDMDRKPDAWAEKRKWFLEQRKKFVPYLDVPAAPLTGTCGRMVDLYDRAQDGKLDETSAREIMDFIRANNRKDLGETDFGDTRQMKRDRIEHLTLQTILSALDQTGAETFLQVAREKKGRRSGLTDLVSFLHRTGEVVRNHTEAMGNVPVQPTYALWDAMRKSGDAKVRAFAFDEQFKNLEFSFETGQGNSTLQKRFSADLRDTSFDVRKTAIDSLFKSDKITPFAERLVAVPEIQDALADNYAKNSEYRLREGRIRSLFRRVDEQKRLALSLLKGNEKIAVCIKTALTKGI